ncbi:MAG: twin-arginine translocation pathway signal protein, partial [Pseudomonadota bacterium]
MATRRSVLRLMGGGVVVAAGSGAGCVALSGPSTSAREAWREAGQETEFRRRALSYALLAPNPHNRQPWLVRLDGETALTLFCDLDRRLPETDPFDRQITIGHGAFLELLRLAAAEQGYRADITTFPEGAPGHRLDQRPVAQVAFTRENAMPDPLFAQVLARRTNREVYKDQDVPAEALSAFVETGGAFGCTAGAIGNDARAATLRDLTWSAHQVEAATPRTHQESVDLMRLGAEEVKRHRDGIVLEGRMIALGRAFGAVSRKTLADPNSSAFKQGLEMYEKKAMSARAFAWIETAGDTRDHQLAAGRAYMRLTLKATELGLAVHPWSQALQEYAEMSDL